MFPSLGKRFMDETTLWVKDFDDPNAKLHGSILCKMIDAKHCAHHCTKEYHIQRHGDIVQNITVSLPQNQQNTSVTLSIAGTELWSCTTCLECVVIPYSINLVSTQFDTIRVVVVDHSGSDFANCLPIVSGEYIMFEEKEYRRRMAQHGSHMRNEIDKYWWEWPYDSRKHVKAEESSTRAAFDNFYCLAIFLVLFSTMAWRMAETKTYV